MPGVISESYTAPHLDVPTYDQIVAFGRYLASEKDFNVDRLLEYFESPWKWEREYRTWRRFGVTDASELDERDFQDQPAERAAAKLRKGMSHADYKRIIDEEYSAKGYCWKCAEEFPMSELIEDDNPYIKDETDPNDKNYQCKPCMEADEQ